MLDQTEAHTLPLLVEGTFSTDPMPYSLLTLSKWSTRNAVAADVHTSRLPGNPNGTTQSEKEVRRKREVLPPSNFNKTWVNVTPMIPMNRPILRMLL